LYVAMAVHFPKGAREEGVMMEEMKKFAEVQSKHKGFIQLFVGEVEDKGIIIPFTLWETEADAMAARMDIGKYLSTFDFKTNQEGPTRAGGVAPSKGYYSPPSRSRASSRLLPNNNLPGAEPRHPDLRLLSKKHRDVSSTILLRFLREIRWLVSVWFLRICSLRRRIGS
jgi:hypothetical protein